MLVSYVVTTYNQEETILQTLESILNQNVNTDHYEIIVCDDFSKDNTAEIAKNWFKNNQKINGQVLVPKENQGTVKNLIMGVNAAKGDYILSLAGDDWLTENSAYKIYEYLSDKKPAVVCTNMIFYYEQKNEFVQNILEKDYSRFYCATPKKQKNLLTYHNYVYAPSVYICTDIIKKIIPTISCYKYMEDYPMWYAITGLGYHIDFLDVNGVYYRQGENNITNTQTLKPHQKQYYQDIINFKEYCLKDNKSLYTFYNKLYIKQHILALKHMIGNISESEYISKSRVLKIFNIARYINFIIRKRK